MTEMMTKRASEQQVRFTILTQYFPPETGAAQVRLLALAKHLRRRGHAITVVTAFPNYPGGKVFPGYNGRWFQRETIGDIPVLRSWIYPATGRNPFKRLASYFSFTISSLLGLALAPRADVLFVESPPLFLCISAWLASVLRRQRLCLNISDLWPDSVVAVGMMAEGGFVRAARLLERWLYGRAWHISAATKGIVDMILVKGVDRQKVSLLPNGVELAQFVPALPPGDVVKSFLYAGTHGYAHGLEVAVRAAALLRDRNDVQIQFVGDGADKPRICALAAELELTNVSFHDPVPCEEVPALLARSYAALVTVAPGPFFSGTRSAKILPAMAAGRAIVHCGEGEGADLVRESQAGIVTAPGDAEALAEAVVLLANDPAKTYTMGLRGRAFAERQYDWASILDRWLEGVGAELKTREELDRIRREYGRRAADPQVSRMYSPLQPANLFAVQGRERVFLELLRAEGITTLAAKLVLDVGCGFGGELHRLVGYGATPHLLHGVDLIGERLDAAHLVAPHLSFTQGDASALPYSDAQFDIVMQFTLLSSILNPLMRHQVAAEMLRVLKPEGMIIWYDFWWNPTNHATRGIRLAEIRSLFPNCHYRIRRVTLAPPIARLVAPRSWLAAHLLEKLPFLKTHYLVTVRKARGSQNV